MQLEGRVGIITGAAQGIGREYALGTAREGARVVVADLDDAQPVADEIVAAGGEAIAVRTNITDAADNAALAAAAVDAFGQIDFLVNNAALYGKLTPKFWMDIDPAEFERVMHINVTGMFLVCRAIAPVMMQRGYGKIINISSGTALYGSPGLLHYVASKAAVIGMTRALARELGSTGVRVNAITPGFVMSEGSKELMRSGGMEEVADPTLMARAIQREQQPEDLVGTVVYLASAASDYVTAQVLNVDGGWVAY